MSRRQSITALVVESVESRLQSMESRFGLVLTSVCLGILLFVTSSLYAPPEFSLKGYYGYHAVAPLNPESLENVDLRRVYRILSPLLANVLGFVGKSYVYFEKLAIVAFISLVYFFYRKIGYSINYSLGICLILPFSLLVIHPNVWPGYADVIAFIFIFLIFISIEQERIILPWILFFLALLNHEVVLFQLPFFVAFQYYTVWKGNNHNRSVYLAVVLPLLSVVCYVVYVALFTKFVYPTNPLFIYTPVSDSTFGDTGFLWEIKRAFPGYLPGIFSVFKLYWSLPVVAVLGSLRSRDLYKSGLILMPFFGSIVSLIKGIDVSRMVMFSFLTIFVSLWYLRDYYSDRILARGILILTVMNIFVPQFIVVGPRTLAVDTYWDLFVQFVTNYI